jgi:uncharacterized membrane protein
MKEVVAPDLLGFFNFTIMTEKEIAIQEMEVECAKRILKVAEILCRDDYELSYDIALKAAATAVQTVWHIEWIT